MDTRRRWQVVSWVSLGLIALAFLADSWLAGVYIPAKFALFDKFNLTLPAPMILPMQVSNFFNETINSIITAPLLLIAALALVLKEFRMKSLPARLGINLSVLFLLLVFFGVEMFGAILVMMKLKEALG